MSHLTTKERMLLQDQLNHEEICIRKYSEYAEKTDDAQLKNMFYNLADREIGHYNAIQALLENPNSFQQKSTEGLESQYLKGAMEAGDLNTGNWAWGTQDKGRSGQQFQGGASANAFQGGWNYGQNQASLGTRFISQQKPGQTVSPHGIHDEKSMLSDMLMTEKYISGTYDTAIFESVNPIIRQTLQDIQRDEQQHGEEIFNYMHQKGMYKVQ